MLSNWGYLFAIYMCVIMLCNTFWWERIITHYTEGFSRWTPEGFAWYRWGGELSQKGKRRPWFYSFTSQIWFQKQSSTRDMGQHSSTDCPCKGFRPGVAISNVYVEHIGNINEEFGPGSAGERNEASRVHSVWREQAGPCFCRFLSDVNMGPLLPE